MIQEYEFEILINPSNLFNNITEVRDFISLSDDIMELEAFLNDCLKEELYFYCVIIRDKINRLT